jgi:hypothetical protein
MPTKRRDIVRKVRHFGGWEDDGRGKGGHRLLMRRDPENAAGTLAYPLQFHGGNQDFPGSVARAPTCHHCITQERSRRSRAPRRPAPRARTSVARGA